MFGPWLNGTGHEFRSFDKKWTVRSNYQPLVFGRLWRGHFFFYMQNARVKVGYQKWVLIYERSEL
jgi:hypothetical protein